MHHKLKSIHQIKVLGRGANITKTKMSTGGKFVLFFCLHMNPKALGTKIFWCYHELLISSFTIPLIFYSICAWVTFSLTYI